MDAAAAYIKRFSPDAAQRWFAGLTEAVLSLEEMPRRHALAPEADHLGVELRQLIYGKRAGRFRVVFRVYDDAEPPVVRVAAIRHGARDRLTAEDLQDIL